jgi:hypothetical protein
MDVMEADYDLSHVDVDDELETYLAEYRQVVQELTEDGAEVPARRTDERRTIKRFAMEEAALVAPYAAAWLQEKQAAMGNGRYTNETPGEKYGHQLISRLGQIWQAVDKRKAPKLLSDGRGNGKQVEEPNRIDMTTRILEGSAKGDNISEQYRSLADINDVIPGDDVVALLAGCTEMGVRGARRAARQLGYAFDRISPGEIGESMSGHGWWRVTERPSEEALARARLAEMDKDALLSLLYDVIDE